MYSVKVLHLSTAQKYAFKILAHAFFCFVLASLKNKAEEKTTNAGYNKA